MLNRLFFGDSMQVQQKENAGLTCCRIWIFSANICKLRNLNQYLKKHAYQRSTGALDDPMAYGLGSVI